MIQGIPILLPKLLDDFGLSYLAAGVISSAFRISSAAAYPVFAYYSDRTGRRKFVTISGLILFFFGLASLGASWNYACLVLFATIAGLGQCVYHPQALSFLNFVFNREVGVAVGVHGASGMAGLVTLPIVLAYVAVVYGWRVANLFVFGPLVAIVTLLIFLFLSDPLKKEAAKISLVRLPLRSIAIVMFYSALTGICFICGSTFLPLYFTKICGYSLTTAALFISIMNASGIVGQLIAGYGSEKVGLKKLLIITSFLFAILFYTFLNVKEYSLLQLFPLCFSWIFINASNPLVMIAVTDQVPRESVATIFAIIQAISMGAAAATSILIGSIADMFGLTLALVTLTIAAIASGTICIIYPGASRRI